MTYTADARSTVRDLKQENGAAIYLCGGGLRVREEPGLDAVGPRLAR